MARLTLREFSDQALAYARSHNREWGVRLGEDNRLIYVGPGSGASGAVDLTGLYHAYLRSGGAPEQVFAKALDLASRSEPSLEFAASAARLVPLLVTPEFVRSSHAQPGATRLLTESWTPGLSIALALDQPERFEFVTIRHTERWGVTIAAAEQRAFRNLRERTPAAWPADLPRDQALDLVFGDALPSSRLLLALDLPPAAGARTLLAVPDRNALHVMVTGDQGLIEEFRWLTVEVNRRRSSRPLSPTVYERVSDGLAILDPPAEPAGRRRRVRLRLRRRG